MTTEIAVPERQEQFLEAFVECNGDLNEARAKAKLSKLTFYRWMREDETFRKRVDEYRLALADEIESEAVRRVMNPEGQRGSDALATTLLKGLKKERYGDADKAGGTATIIYISGLRENPRPGVELPDGRGPASPALPPGDVIEAPFTEVPAPAGELVEPAGQ